MEPGEITNLLRDVAAGNRDAEERLLPLVYDELSRLASSLMRRERPGHVLQTTALVHEAYLRLFGGSDPDWANRGHFFAVAATAMRRILVDHARALQARKREGDVTRVAFSETLPGSPESWDQILAVNAALDKLSRIDPRAARVVELKFFVGLSVDEAAEALGVTGRTVKRDWDFAQRWLYAEMAGPQ